MTGTISPAADPHTPFTADERDRFYGVGVEIRICGDRLFSMLEPNADRLVGRLGGPYFRAQGHLAITTATGNQPWNGDHVSSPVLITCDLHNGMPAVYRSWPAAVVS